MIIEEKWALAPVLFLSTDESKFIGGLFVLESNLFGYTITNESGIWRNGRDARTVGLGYSLTPDIPLAGRPKNG